MARRRQAGRDSRVIAIRPHALTQKVNVGGLRIEARQCRLRRSRYRTADSAINQSVSAPNRRPAALIRDEFSGASFPRNITLEHRIDAPSEPISAVEIPLCAYDSSYFPISIRNTPRTSESARKNRPESKYSGIFAPKIRFKEKRV